jgi:HEAT repeat protein
MHGLLTALRDNDKAMRRMAALELKLFEKHPAAILPGLTEALRDEDVEVRKEAAATLSRFCCRDEANALAAAFTDALADESFAVRQQAACALAYLNPPRDAGAAVLMDGLQCGTALERVSAAAALGRIRHQASIPFLGRACADQDCGVRSAAAQTLGRFGPDAKTAVPLLLVCMNDEDFVVRHLAADAVGAIAPESLIASLRPEAPGVRATAAYALTRIQPRVKAAVPALIEALNDPSPDVRAVAGKALEGVLLWGRLQ